MLLEIEPLPQTVFEVILPALSVTVSVLPVAGGISSQVVVGVPKLV